MKPLKKCLFVLFGVLFSLNTVFAQTDLFSSRFLSHGYLPFGYSYSKGFGNDKYNTTMHGVHVGFLFDFPLTRTKENLLIEYGGVYNLGVGEYKEVNENLSHWIEVPVRIKTITDILSVDDISLALHLFAGLNFSYALSHKYKNLEFDRYELEVDGSRLYTQFDVQIDVGAEYNINERFGIRVMFDYGVLNRSRMNSTIWRNSNFKVSFVLYPDI